MSKLVKTGKEIHNLGFSDYGAGEYQRIQKDMEKKYLILPHGLDKLEEMLKEEINKYIIGVDIDEEISSVFARFKKENKI